MVAPARPTVGVLAVQGDVAPHRAAIERLGAEARDVRTLRELQSVDALILPGGESTTIGLFLTTTGLDAAIRERHAQRRLPLFGTCAGLIVLATTVVDAPNQPRLGVLDVAVRRNAFGRQRESCESTVDVPALAGAPLRALFIRAPFIEQTGPGVTVLARWNDRMVLVQANGILGAAFHPELAGDDRLHQLFLGMINRSDRSSHPD